MENIDLEKREAPQEELLEMLKLEQAVLERGGYGSPVSSPRESPIHLRDSVTCLNFGRTEDEPPEPCDHCWLMTFVPDKHRGDVLPCHHIPLNKMGETLASLRGANDTDQVQQALGNWLDKTIASLEAR